MQFDFQNTEAKLHIFWNKYKTLLELRTRISERNAMVFTLCVVSEPRSKKNKIEESDRKSVIRSEPQKSKSTIVENYKAYSFCATDHIAIYFEFVGLGPIGMQIV